MIEELSLVKQADEHDIPKGEFMLANARELFGGMKDDKNILYRWFPM
jgi:hypothetical protein